jgi:dynein heavy chain
MGLNGFLFGGIAENKSKNNNNSDEFQEEASATNEMYNLSLGSTGFEWALITSKNPQPLPRWHHTATLYDNTQLIIFGGFHNPTHRLNDLWIFNIVDYSWKEPHIEHNKESSTPCQLVNHAWNNAPSARGAHTATIIGENLYIFGGYGGQGYSRRELDDLYALNLETMVWTKVQAKGIPPEKRSGHQACAIEKKIYIFGGWNSSTQFNDLHILDTEFDPPVWSKLQSALQTPTWNLAACSVVAIPTWKIFTFGGTTGVLSDHDRQVLLN